MNAATASPPAGVHLVASRRGYMHHGISVGNGCVVHYAGISRSPGGLIEETTLAAFSAGHEVSRVPHARTRFGALQIVARARSRLGEHAYDLLRNNCEHFCEWCLNGERRSSQVDRSLAAARRLARALLAAVCVALGAPALADDPASLAAHVEGEGSTTIVLLSGLGDTLDVWADVQPAMAASCARTFAYTRAGYAGSPPASGPRDAAMIASELRAELQRRGIFPPYVLVGHSLGGLYAQYFAREFASEVKGLLLVDSTHWNQQLPSTLGAPSKYAPQSAFLYMPLIMRRELADSTRAGEQVHASADGRDVPTIVLSRTRALRGEAPEARMLAASLQQEIAADFPAAVHVRVEGSGHYIHRDRPEVVIDSARQLAGCGSIDLGQTILRVNTP
ncbi:MAG: alpha/beta fold hydrolase [Steroidobacteraceae bacterium]